MKPRRLTLRELLKLQTTIIVECGPRAPEKSAPSCTVTIHDVDSGPIELMSKWPLRGRRYERPTRYDPPPE